MQDQKKIDVDIVTPVFNEEKILKKNVLILMDFLKKNANFEWKIIIVDNGSIDNTLEIAREISEKYDQIESLHISNKGRGKALRYAWMHSNAQIVSYMDIDLSTNITYFIPIINKLIMGYDIAVGSRLLKQSIVKREFIRKLLSRFYNLLIRLLFSTNLSDTQCGFKAIKTEVAKYLIPKIKNNNWFFDTELLILAGRYKYRISEVPIEWAENSKTKVNIIMTIFEDLYGLIRLKFSKI